MDSPVGPLTIASGDEGLESIRFGRNIPTSVVAAPGPGSAALGQLRQYFAGKRQQFDLPLALAGTPFQLSVWEELSRIPYGETRSYGQIADRLGKHGAARAVGMANHVNPIPIIIPCHRVVRHDGSLTGYAGGLNIKESLLSLEGALTIKEQKATGAGARGRSTAVGPSLFA